MGLPRRSICAEMSRTLGDLNARVLRALAEVPQGSVSHFTWSEVGIKDLSVEMILNDRCFRFLCQISRTEQMNNFACLFDVSFLGRL